jgi:hypothetical protein
MLFVNGEYSCMESLLKLRQTIILALPGYAAGTVETADSVVRRIGRI